MTWQLANKTLTSRLLLGTANYPSLEILQQAISASGCEVVTVSLRRCEPLPSSSHVLKTATPPQRFWQAIAGLGCHVLPNTAGCYRAEEALAVAEMARELFGVSWVKLEIIGDDYNLQPNPFELLRATELLIARDFTVLPYCTDDLVLCQQLVTRGCSVLMPWASPIGTALGLINPYALTALRARFPQITLLVDAGIGRPSHAVQAMELGFDGVLLNTAVAGACDPIQMATGFKHAVIAGRAAFEAGMLPPRQTAIPSSPLVDVPFWQQTS